MKKLTFQQIREATKNQYLVIPIIMDIAKEFDACENIEQLLNLLDELGFNRNYEGYEFILEAIMEEPQEHKTIKSFENVQIGDIAFENPSAGGEWGNEQGPVLWKGTFEEVQQSKWNYLLEEWEMHDFEDTHELDECNFVVVYLPMYGATLFNYNYDPCGLVCFE